jgi:hypothetical protein
MAEEEKIREHVKRALQGLTNKKKWKERIKDFLWGNVHYCCGCEHYALVS